MKLFEIETGVTFWIAAEDAEGAKQVLRDCGEPEDEPFEVEELTEEKARKIAYHPNTGEDSALTMWDGFQEMKEPGFVACSDW